MCSAAQLIFDWEVSCNFIALYNVTSVYLLLLPDSVFLLYFPVRLLFVMMNCLKPRADQPIKIIVI